MPAKIESALVVPFRPIIVSSRRACPRLVPSHDGALVASIRLIRVLGLLDLRNELLKGLGDVLVIASTRLGPGTLQLLGKFLAVLGGNLTLLRAKIALVADNNNGKPLNTLRSKRPLAPTT